MGRVTADAGEIFRFSAFMNAFLPTWLALFVK
jgi:hypothetical protein